MAGLDAGNQARDLDIEVAAGEQSWARLSEREAVGLGHLLKRGARRKAGDVEQRHGPPPSPVEGEGGAGRAIRSRLNG
jgi:hypothetical protein